MTKTVTASGAKNRLGALLAEIRRDQEAVIVENRGADRRHYSVSRL
jgi:hypothetical protein